jgi:integrase
MRGIARAKGVRAVQSAPLLRRHLAKIIDSPPTGLDDARRACILLVGFFGALRRSELTRLRWSDMELRSEGLGVHLRSGKTDQVRSGRIVWLAARPDRLCPLATAERWRQVSGGVGFVFPGRGGSASSEHSRLSPEIVTRMVKQSVAGIGLSPHAYSAHSLRAGFVTQSLLDGEDPIKIARITGHRSLSGLVPYFRPVGGNGIAIDCTPKQLAMVANFGPRP